MKKSSLRMVSVSIISAMLVLSGCASQQQNVRYMPNQGQQNVNGYGNQGNQLFDPESFAGLFLEKRLNGLPTLLALGSDVATETLLGTEVYETFLQNGWVQVTRADAKSKMEVDVLCRLGAANEKVAAQCLSDSRVAPAKATATVDADRSSIARVGGIERARNAMISFVERQQGMVRDAAIIRRQSGYR